MRLPRLIDGLPIRLHSGSDRTDITGATEDSREVRPGDLFVARSGGSTDGRRFATDAVHRGARAVLSETPVDVPATVLLADAVTPELAGALADRLYATPAERLALVGVTGTNGKTTVTQMVRHLLRTDGRRCGLIGTIEVDDGVDRTSAGLTTPGPIALRALLHRMVRNGCEACVMEVSSHALEQGRVAGVPFAAGVFTNLSGDHLDYHGTMEAYAAAKARLWEGVGPRRTAVVNRDDPYADRMIHACRDRPWTYTLCDDPRADARAVVREAAPSHAMSLFEGPWGRFEQRLPLAGHHNVANMVAALLACHGLGVARETLARGVGACPPVPGRLEIVRPDRDGSPCTVIVDYAHSDDALANVLRAVRPVTPGRLHLVFGCGGDRDPTKRPRMGRAAADHADALWVTSDNPRSEPPDAIIEQILAGLTRGERRRAATVVDRAAAIQRAVRHARPGDVVLITGKGHEPYQEVGDAVRPFDDRVEAARAIEAAKEDTQ